MKNLLLQISILILVLMLILPGLSYGLPSGSGDPVISIYYKNGFAHLSVAWPAKEKRGYKQVWTFNNSTEREIKVPISELPGSVCVELECFCKKKATECIPIPECSEYPTYIQGGVKGASCNGISDGEIDLISSGKGPFTYEWNTGRSTARVTGLRAGYYTVTVYNQYGCDTQKEFEIKEPDPLNTSMIEIKSIPPLCYGGNDAKAEVVENDETGSFSFLWNNGSRGIGAAGLSAGINSVRVADNKGRCSSIPFKIESPEKISLESLIVSNYNGQEISCHNSADGSALLSITGGISPYEVNFKGRLYTPVNHGDKLNLKDLSGGFHPVSITDNNGCKTEAGFIIKAPDSLLVQISAPSKKGVHIFCKGDSTGQIIATAQGGTGNYHFQWTTDSGKIIGESASVSFLRAGSYNLKVTDANGCSANPVSQNLIEPQKSIIVSFKPIISTPLFVYGKYKVMGGMKGYKINGEEKNSFKVFTFRPYKYHKIQIEDEVDCTLWVSRTVFKPELKDATGNTNIKQKKHRNGKMPCPPVCN